MLNHITGVSAEKQASDDARKRHIAPLERCRAISGIVAN